MKCIVPGPENPRTVLYLICEYSFDILERNPQKELIKLSLMRTFIVSLYHILFRHLFYFYLQGSLQYSFFYIYIIQYFSLSMFFLLFHDYVTVLYKLQL